MESVNETTNYKELYAQLVKEYKTYLYRKNLINKKSYKRKDKLVCPICKSLNQNISLFCQNCGVKLQYSFINYL